MRTTYKPAGTRFPYLLKCGREICLATSLTGEVLPLHRVITPWGLKELWHIICLTVKGV